MLQPLSPCALQPVLHRKRSHRNEKPLHGNKSSPPTPRLEKALEQQPRLSTAEKKKNNRLHLSPPGQSPVNPSLLSDLSTLPEDVTQAELGPLCFTGAEPIVWQPCSIQASIFYDQMRTMLYQLFNILIIISAYRQSRTFFRHSLCSRMNSSVGENTNMFSI